VAQPPVGRQELSARELLKQPQAVELQSATWQQRVEVALRERALLKPPMVPMAPSAGAQPQQAEVANSQAMPEMSRTGRLLQQ
jgi:hypothetical protein